MFKPTSILIALAMTCAMATFTAQPTAAQTATNLKCKGCVNSRDIKNGGIRSRDIRNGQVKNADLATGAVSGAKVQDGSLTALDLGDEAGVDFVGGFQTLILDLDMDTVVRSVTVTAPGPGFVILNASGLFSFGANALVRCSLTTGTAVEGTDRQVAGLVNDPHFQFFGMTEGFTVAAGSTTFNLVCEETNEGVVIQDSDLTAIYAPTRY